MTTRKLADADYERALAFRTGIRRFLEWSRARAADVGMTPTQHQLALAIRGRRGYRAGATIGEIAGSLLVRHNSAVELVNRAESAGFVARSSDPEDGRIVRVVLTRKGERALEHITRANFEELDRLAPQLTRLLGRASASDA